MDASSARSLANHSTQSFSGTHAQLQDGCRRTQGVATCPFDLSLTLSTRWLIVLCFLPGFFGSYQRLQLGAWQTVLSNTPTLRVSPRQRQGPEKWTFMARDARAEVFPLGSKRKHTTDGALIARHSSWILLKFLYQIYLLSVTFFPNRAWLCYYFPSPTFLKYTTLFFLTVHSTGICPFLLATRVGTQ